jgi:phosphatidate cytidylyltransferase
MPAIPKLVWILAATIALIWPLALLAGRRGGHYRGLPGWIGGWTQFALLVLALSRMSPKFSFPVLGIVMFVALKQYYFLTPLRPQDRWAIFLSYLAIPLALWPAWNGSFGGLTAATVVGLFLLIPVLLSVAPSQPGLLDALGRVLLGVFVFVFCASHFGLMRQLSDGSLELFAITALLADLPQRLLGQMRPGGGNLRSMFGLVVSVAMAAGAGAGLSSFAGVGALHGGVAGALAALGMAGGALVSAAVANELERTQSDSRLGRAAFLDRTMPVIYAAPVFYHYLRAVAS